jgi:hypothetical protein
VTAHFSRTEYSELLRKGGKRIVVQETKAAAPKRGAFGLDKPAGEKRGRYVVSAPERRTSNGIVFDSQAEMRRFHDLKIQERLGEIERGSIELQPRFELVVNGVKISSYRCDFCYRRAPVGTVVFEELKSDGTAREKDWRLRRKLAEAIYGVTITEVRI